MSTSTKVADLKINKLTKQQYEGITTPSNTELYFITDDSGLTSTDVTTALGYTPSAKITVSCPALTSSGGVCVWTIDETTAVSMYPADITVLQGSTNKKILADVSWHAISSAYQVKVNSASNIAAGELKAIIVF